MSIPQSLKYITTNLRNLRMRGEDVGDEWIMHTIPHRNSKYYYHRKLKLVTTEDMTDPETRGTFLSTYRHEVGRNRPLETFVNAKGEAYVANHNTQTLDSMSGSPVSADESRSNYWIYLSNFPCHHKLPKNAEKDTLTMLQLMIVRKHISQEPYTYIFIS